MSSGLGFAGESLSCAALLDFGAVRRHLAQQHRKFDITQRPRRAEPTFAFVGRFEAPFQHLAFLALSVIPSLKLTDRGLVDVDRFELVPLEVA